MVYLSTQEPHSPSISSFSVRRESKDFFKERKTCILKLSHEISFESTPDIPAIFSVDKSHAEIDATGVQEIATALTSCFT